MLRLTGSKTVFPARDDAWTRFFNGGNPWGVTAYEQLTDAQKRCLLGASTINMAYLTYMLANTGDSESQSGEGTALRRATQYSYLDSIQWCQDARQLAAPFWQKYQQTGVRLADQGDINEIPRTCGAFKPVYGNASSSVGAESLMTYENDKYVYVAVFNYQMLPSAAQLPFADLDIDAASIKEIKELWTGSAITHSAVGFQYSVPAYDARVYRIEKNGSLGIVPADRLQLANSVYDLQGRKMTDALKRGIYIRNQKKYIVK